MNLPAPFSTLSAEDAAILATHLRPVRFPAGSRIFKAGEKADACYLVDAGTVRVDLDGASTAGSEVDSDATLAYIEPGGLLGELGLLDSLPRSATAIAQTDVEARGLDRTALETLIGAHPALACALYAALGRAAAHKLRGANDRLAAVSLQDTPDPVVETMVARAVAAQRAFAQWPEARVDALLAAIAGAIGGQAEELARACVAATHMGNVESKTIKNRLCSLGVADALAGQPGQGPLGTDAARGVTEIAAPVGVVFGLIPITNPVSTCAYKTLIALKGRNALILSPHRLTLTLAARVESLITEALRAHGAPEYLVQCVRSRTSRKQTAQFMAHHDVSLILATGGAGMVKAAYSSGTPAIGVGPGNTPVLVCADAEPDRVAGQIVLSKSFDNGLLCGAEHNLVVVQAARAAFVAACERQGAAVLSAEEAARCAARLVDPVTRRLRLQAIGQSAAALADHCGIARPTPIRLLVVPMDEAAVGDPLGAPFACEKLAPLVSLFTVPDDERGIALCQALLAIDGCGHTAVIHGHDEALIARFAAAMPASRILANTPAMHGMLGLSTGLSFSTTLGCGTFGGTSTTDNVTYRHLLNIKRLAHHAPVIAAAWARFTG